MKLKLALLSSLVALGGSVQAADTSAPDMLSSVSPESVQAMSNAESADARGAYIYIHKGGNVKTGYSKKYYEIGKTYGDIKIVDRGKKSLFGTYRSR